MADLLRQQINSPRGENPYGGSSGSSFKIDIDTKPVAEFVGYLREANQQLRVFSRSLEMVSEKIEELLQNENLKNAGSFNGNNKPQPSGNNQQQQLPQAYPVSPLVKPYQQMIPNQWGGFNVYQMQPQAQPITQVPAQVMNPAQARRRNARRRFLLRRLQSRRKWSKNLSGMARGAYYGGIFGGVKGAMRGGFMSAGFRSMTNPYMKAGAAAMAMPWIMSATAMSAERQVDANRQYAVGAPDTIKALVQYDLNTFRRGMELAQATSPTAVRLIEAQDRERAAQQPFDIMTRNVGNVTSTVLSSMSESFFRNTKGIWDGINGVATDDGVGRGAEAAGAVAGGAATGAMIGTALGLLTIPVLGFFGPALGAAVGSLFGAGAELGKQINNGGPIAAPKAFQLNRDRDFLDMGFAPKPRKI